MMRKLLVLILLIMSISKTQAQDDLYKKPGWRNGKIQKNI